MKSPNRILLLLAGMLTLVLAPSCREPEVLVERITIEPDQVELFVDDFKRVSVNTFPHFAENEDELEYSVEKPAIASFDGHTIVGRKEGRTEVYATCGSASASCQVRVFVWKLSLEDTDYGITSATGILRRKGKTSPQELEIHLAHEAFDGHSQHFVVWLPIEQIGKNIHFSDPINGVFAAGYYDDLKDGFITCTMLEEAPLVVNADWTDAEGISLLDGSLLVEQLDAGNRYRVKGKIRLSNGFNYSANWEGTVSLKVE